MRSGRGCVIAVYGPTACGKTGLAVEIASRLGVRVVSADSMQIYRGFPVLTNQPSASEAARAPHEMVAIAEPDEEWTVARYAPEARRLIDEDVDRHGWSVVAGGTGLYLRASLAPLDVPGVHDEELRAELNRRLEAGGLESLVAELRTIDPGAAEAIDEQNPRRVVRALEVVRSQGPGSWTGRDDLWKPDYRHPTLLVGLMRDREELYERIARRAAEMMKTGAVDEVAAYLGERAGRGERFAQGVVRRSGKGVTKAIGFREIGRYLAGEQTLEETTGQLAAAHRRYARSQLTWLRRMEDVVMMNASVRGVRDMADEIIALAAVRSGCG